MGIHKKTLTLNLPLTKLQCSPLEKNKKSRHPPHRFWILLLPWPLPPSHLHLPSPSLSSLNLPPQRTSRPQDIPSTLIQSSRSFPQPKPEKQREPRPSAPFLNSLPTVPPAQHHFPSTLTGPNKPSSPLSLPQPLCNPTPNFFPQISHSSAVHRFTAHRQLQTGQNPNASSPMVTPLAAWNREQRGNEKKPSCEERCRSVEQKTKTKLKSTAVVRCFPYCRCRWPSPPA